MTIQKVSGFMPYSFDKISIDSFIDLEGTAWFHGVQVCNILGFSNPSVSIPQHTDEDERQKIDIGTLHDAWFISEPGLYGLVMSSKKDEAKIFKRWVKHEVLPDIRKRGGYISPDATQNQLADLKSEIELKLLSIEKAYDVCKDMGDDRGMIEMRSSILNLSNKINNLDDSIPEGWLTVSEILENKGYKFNSDKMKNSVSPLSKNCKKDYEYKTGKPVLVTTKFLASGHKSKTISSYPPDWFDNIEQIAIAYWDFKGIIYK